MLSEVEKRALLVSLVEKMKKSDSWCGETHVQKCVYFLQDMLNVPMGYRYKLYKHGPYSFSLNHELTYLRGNAFLELHPRRPYGPSLSVGKLGKVLKDKYKKAISRYALEVDFVVDVLAAKTVKELEKVATALYVKKEKEWADDDDIVKQIVQLKPHISEEEARWALDYLKEIEESAETVKKKIG